MIEDLFSPVPAAGAPAFWTKNTSSVGGYLIAIADQRPSTKAWRCRDRCQAYHVTASWNMGSESEEAIKVKDGLRPITS
jgi:hypothetical protein